MSGLRLVDSSSLAREVHMFASKHIQSSAVIEPLDCRALRWAAERADLMFILLCA